MRHFAALLLLGSPAFAEVHFHHLMLNSTDPAAAINFYTSRFDCEPAKFEGKQNAVWTQKSWILFNKVKTAPPSAIQSSIWHFGWGAENMPKTYQDQLAKGTKFETPITDISDLARVPNFFYTYVSGPDGALIELNTAGHHRFGHLHLFSADPVSAGEWWGKHLGVKYPPAGRTPSRDIRMYRDVQVGPSASFMLDNVNVIIFPLAYLKGSTELVSTRNRVVDHVGLSVDDLNAALAKLLSEGVKVLSPIKKLKGTNVRAAMIEGPDKLAIQLVEGHARKQ